MLTLMTYKDDCILACSPENKKYWDHFVKYLENKLTGSLLDPMSQFVGLTILRYRESVKLRKQQNGDLNRLMMLNRYNVDDYKTPRNNNETTDGTGNLPEDKILEHHETTQIQYKGAIDSAAGYDVVKTRTADGTRTVS